MSVDCLYIYLYQLWLVHSQNMNSAFDSSVEKKEEGVCALVAAGELGLRNSLQVPVAGSCREDGVVRKKPKSVQAANRGAVSG